MNLQDYIEQIKGWIGRQCFLVRHYRIAIFIFFILALAMIVVGIFYPHEEEHININSAQSEGTIDHQRKVDAKEKSQGKSNKKIHDNDNGKSSKDGVDNKAVHDEKDDSIVKGRLLYDVSSVERPHPWREVFKNISSTDLLHQNDGTRDFDDDYEEMDDLNNMSDDEWAIVNGNLSSEKKGVRKYRRTKNKTIRTDRKKLKELNGDTTKPIELVGIIEGNQNIAILRKGSEEQMVTVGSSWQGISVSNINASGVEIIEGGSSRWLKIE